MLEGIVHGIIVVIIVYLITGLISGLSFIALCIIDNLRGKVDYKFGPAWKSSMTYIIAFSMACPLLNFFWAVVIYRNIENHVRNRI